VISVIIPALNESETIGAAVEFAWRDPKVGEVIVVDDGSVDGTPEVAKRAGARVITSTLLGKGASMEDGLWDAHHEVLLYFDGDMSGLHPDLVSRMTRPILEGAADFVKARFSRRAGRVTTLTAKPLLKMFFPEVAHFEQPLGGVVAARRSLLRTFRFETDYGVDVGLLLEAAATGASLAEVDIGHVEHHGRPLEALGEMAAQVVRTVVDRAARYGRLRVSQIRDIDGLAEIPHGILAGLLQKVGRPKRLALFDMDGTLLKGRYVTTLARRTNRHAALAAYLDNPQQAPPDRTRRIAGVLAGVPRTVFEDTARTMPLMPGAVETVVGLRKAGYCVGVVTDGFQVAADMVRRRVFADFAIAHVLKFYHGKASGEVVLSPAMAHPRGCALHACCKVNAMHHLLDKTDLQPADVLAVGDGDNDVCLLRRAGTSVAFRPKTAAVQAAANFVVTGPLTGVLSALQDRAGSIPA